MLQRISNQAQTEPAPGTSRKPRTKGRACEPGKPRMNDREGRRMDIMSDQFGEFVTS